MAGDIEVFRRNCHIVGQSGAAQRLAVVFYAPLKNPRADDYLARASISCKFFEKDVYATGEDPAQAFFSLPAAVVSYLIGVRREGYETYWLERGDLDDRDFWTYAK